MRILRLLLLLAGLSAWSGCAATLTSLHEKYPGHVVADMKVITGEESADPFGERTAAPGWNRNSGSSSNRRDRYVEDRYILVLDKPSGGSLEVQVSPEVFNQVSLGETLGK